ncbi:hypothetical protein GGR50DRAFT_42703 [Xylaria sp. CBS 124048]|nr:hypothetical protein GGR50DRAFT_42703 [Xylaria sp. CBS 124048]
MAYSRELASAFPPPMKMQVPAPISETGKQRRQFQRRSQSMPFDPDDLSRRLLVVLAEREAEKEKDLRRQKRADAFLHPRRAQAAREHHHPYLEGNTNATTAKTTRTTWAVSDATAHAERPSKPKSKPSLQERLRHRAFASSSSTALVPPAPAPAPAPPQLGHAANVAVNGITVYRHVPEQAAAQFSRTTTAANMPHETEVPSLSASALRFYSEGTSSVHHENTTSPAKQRTFLQRARDHRERLRTRNQFQDPIPDGNESRRASRSGPGGVGEVDGAASALADIHLHAFPNQGQRVGDNGQPLSSEDTLVDGVLAAERRADWTQRDELPPRESRRKGLHPLLRKTTSLLTLNGRLSRNSGKNQLRVVTVEEEVDEQGEQADAEVDDGSTPISPGSRRSISRYTGRASVWGRFRRGERT